MVTINELDDVVFIDCVGPIWPPPMSENFIEVALATEGVARTWKRCIVSVDEKCSMHSAGIGHLISFMGKPRDGKQSIRFVCPPSNERLKELLKIVNFREIAKIYDSKEAAIADF